MIKVINMALCPHTFSTMEELASAKFSDGVRTRLGGEEGLVPPGVTGDVVLIGPGVRMGEGVGDVVIVVDRVVESIEDGMVDTPDPDG